jgi:hypothetical protein
MQSKFWLKYCPRDLFVRGICTDKVIEIERKFQVTEAILKAVQKQANCIPDKREIIDTYYDIVSFSQPPFPLTSRDIWLRKRNRVFEIKFPQSEFELTKFPIPEEGQLTGIDFYSESTSWLIIADTLRLASISLSSPLPTEKTSENAIESWLNENKIRKFATIKTMRQRYRFQLPIGEIGMTWISNQKTISNDSIKTHLINVDIDDVEYCNIDYSDKELLPIGDDTLVCGVLGLTYDIGEVELLRASENMPAEVALTDIFDQLGIPMGSARGKVLEFVHRFRPTHFKALELSGLLSKKKL